MSFNTKKAQSSRSKQILCANDKKAQTAKARETRRKNRIYRSASTSPVDNFRLDLNCKSAKNVRQHNILYELLHISQIKQKVSNYMIYPNIKQLSIGLFLISAAAFAYLKVFFHLPDERTVRRWIYDQIQGSIPAQFQLSNAQKILNEYINENNLKDVKDFKVIIAVDAFSVKPNLIIDNDGIRRGTIQEEKVEDSQINAMQESVLTFEKYATENKKTVITNTFIFLVQPLIASYPCFIIHMSPSTQGKATINEIEILIFLMELIKKSGLSVEALAFDGDTTYSKLVKAWNNEVKSVYHNPQSQTANIKNEKVKQFKNKVVVDPLHLLKRWRY